MSNAVSNAAMVDTDSPAASGSMSQIAMSKPYLMSREPWWRTPPKPGQPESELDWGYLEIWSDMSFRFIEERPSDQEIRQRKGCRLGDER